MSDFRKLIPTGCYDCVVDVVGWDFGPEDESTGVNMAVLSGHIPLERHAFFGHNGRLRRAWEALHNRDVDFVEFLDSAELDPVIEALQEARVKVWGSTSASGEAIDHAIRPS